MNLFQWPTPLPPEEWCEELHKDGPVRIERILSTGQVSPEGFWYDQEEHEWVALLQGEARLLVEEREVCLHKGDTLFLPAHTRHRITFTSAEPLCLWLCVFWR